MCWIRWSTALVAVAVTLSAGPSASAATFPLYVSTDGDTAISQVSPTGAVSPFVTSGLNSPEGMAFDAGGNLYAANFNTNSVLRITPAGAVSTFATGLNGPAGLAFDAAGNLYAANLSLGTVHKITPAGAVTPFATGLGQPGRAGVRRRREPVRRRQGQRRGL